MNKIIIALMICLCLLSPTFATKTMFDNQDFKDTFNISNIAWLETANLQATNLESNLDGSGFNITASNFIGALTGLASNATFSWTANSSFFWDSLNTPADINAGDITDDGTYVKIAGDTMSGDFNMSTYTLRLDDDFEVNHSLNDVLSHFDNLVDDTAVDKIQETITIAGETATLNISNADGMDLEFNIDRVTYSAGAQSLTIALTNGTDDAPQINYVTVQEAGGAAVLMSEGSYPSGVEHVDIAKVMVGASGDIVSWNPILIRSYETIYGMYERFEEQGPLYLSGFDTVSDAGTLNISTGSFRSTLTEIEPANNVSMTSFTIILNNGTFVQCTTLACIDEYSDGTAFSAGKFMNVVFGVVAINSTGVELFAVQQGYPGIGKEYANPAFAEADQFNQILFFPSDTNVKASFTPIARVLLDNNNDDLDAFGTGLFHRFLGGQVSGGGSSPSAAVTDHDNLNNLGWSVAAHTFDAALDTGAQDIITTGNLMGVINWTNLSAYPAACPAGSYVTTIGDSTTCTAAVRTTGDTLFGNLVMQDNNVTFWDDDGHVVFGNSSDSDISFNQTCLIIRGPTSTLEIC